MGGRDLVKGTNRRSAASLPKPAPSFRAEFRLLFRPFSAFAEAFQRSSPVLDRAVERPGLRYFSDLLAFLRRGTDGGGGLGREESGTQPGAAGLADRNCKVLGCILDAASLELFLPTPLVLGSFGVYPSVMGRWIRGGVRRYTAQHRSPAVGHPPLGSLALWVSGGFRWLLGSWSSWGWGFG